MAQSSTPPSRQEIDGIIALAAQPVIRNLKITQCYHDLSAAVASVVGAENLNWCSFASWASKTAGRFVRGEPLAIFRDALQSERLLAGKIDRINTLLRHFGAATGLSRVAILTAIEAPVEEVSRHITAGNLAVFAELGPLFSLICSRFDRATSYDGDFLAQLLDDLQLKTGSPERGGQDLLRHAVKGYYQAKFEGHAGRQAELILLANSQTGLHEQIRLQPAIAGALELPFEVAVQALIERQLGGAWPGVARRRLGSPAAKSARPLISEICHDLNRLWREVATRLFMTLRLPDGELHLGEDLRPSSGEALFPASLQTIENDALRAMLAAHRAGGISAAQSGAADWADIRERMHFILTLFRARQQDQRLFEQPFSAAQRSDIEQGRMPRGAL